MLKKISNLGKALNREAQKEIKGGLGSLTSCSYHCNGTSYVLDGGQGQDCYLNNPAIIHNHPSCGGTGGDGPGGLIENWA